MRVITGTARGKKLETLNGEEIRPTTDRVKEAVFNILQFNIEGQNFLDLFAGSGQMGIEALSRGAKKVVFIDSRRESINVVNKNLELVKLKNMANVFNIDAGSYLLKTNEVFDIVFLDPPYYSGEIHRIFPKLAKVVNKNGIIICENPIDEILPEKLEEFILSKVNKYGKIKISIYKKNGVE